MGEAKNRESKSGSRESATERDREKPASSGSAHAEPAERSATGAGRPAGASMPPLADRTPAKKVSPKRHARMHHSGNCPVGCEIRVNGLTQIDRERRARKLRRNAAIDEFNKDKFPLALTVHPCNRDEAKYQADPLYKNRFIASFTKGLKRSTVSPGKELGEVDAGAYCELLHALSTGDKQDFEAIQLGCGDKSRKLEGPQAALAYEIEGADSHAVFLVHPNETPELHSGAPLSFPPAPCFDSETEIAEIAENYWMALLRDVAFDDYATHPLAAAAAAHLSTFSYYQGLFPGGVVTPQMLFRGLLPGDTTGPYVSQFMVRDIPYGAQRISPKIRTTEPGTPEGTDQLTKYDDWLSVQSGCDRDQCTPAMPPSGCDLTDDSKFVYIHRGRDIGQFVHVDTDYNAFLDASLILFPGSKKRRCEAAPGIGAPFGVGLPYANPEANAADESPSKSKTQIGQGTFGPQHLKGLLLEVVPRAFRAVWYQKWAVHRRLRPEEFGGRIHNHLKFLSGTGGGEYPFATVHLDRIRTQNTGGGQSLLDRIFAHNAAINGAAIGGTWLLPMAFAEGCPIHPSYGAGHATTAGACATILKAFFKEDFVIPNPVNIDGSGTCGPYAGGTLTVGGELNKLASNVSLARNIAGVHWRSDHTQSIRLGERIAISILCDQRKLFNEKYYFEFTKFDGQKIRINKHGPCPEVV